MSPALRTNHCLIPTVITLLLYAGTAYGQFGGTSYFAPERFPNVTLDGPRELDTSAWTVVDQAQFMPLKLRQPLTWNFVEMPLNEFAEELARKVGMPVMIDERLLQDLGYELDVPLTESVQNAPAYLLLERQLRDRYLLDWYVAEGIVHITSRERAAKQFVIHVYNVNELLESGCTLPSLIQTLQSVTSDSWENVDGVGGTISAAGHTLVVRQTQRTQREIAGLLEALRHPAQQTVIGDTPYREQIERHLDQTLDAVSFDEVAFATAIAKLADRIGIPIRIDATALIDIGIDPDDLVSLDMENASARTVLRLLLADLDVTSVDLAEFELTSINRNAQLLITSADEAGERPLIVIYDVSDLCRTESQTLALIDVLQSESAGKWYNIDGIGGRIGMPRVGTLAIRQTEQSQREIANLLLQLRKALDGHTLEETGDNNIHTRFYHLPQQQAIDLLRIIPDQIAAGTWQPANPEGVGSLQLITADSEHRSVNHGKNGVTSVELPRSILMVKHHTDVLRKVERFLETMKRDSRPRQNGGASSGGFFSVQPTFVPDFNRNTTSQDDHIRD